MRDAHNIQQIEQLGIHWLGFIFYAKSPRFVAHKPTYMPTQAKRVGVFVNEDINTINTIAQHYSLDILQLHGSETPDMCATLASQGHTVMKALSIKDTFPTELSKSYQQACQYLLFDTQTTHYGGSGSKFNWDIIGDYHHDTPFLLSGGISASDAKQILSIKHPQLVGIDINSRFETKPALKDAHLIQQFLKQLNQQ